MIGRMKALLLIPLLLVNSSGDLSESEFKKLHRDLQPDLSVAWRSIPWKTSVLDGQATAAREGKPLFIWAMDGHPLGCT